MARYARVCVDVRPAHLDRPFDYALEEGVEPVAGQRVVVPFAGRRRTGWVLGVGEDTDADPERVKPLHRLAGDVAWFDEDDLALYRWVARRWAGTLADVLRHAVPPRVAAVEAEAARWGEPDGPSRAERPPCPARTWRPYDASALLKATSGRGEADPPPAFWLRPLPGDDPALLAADLVARTLASGRRALVLSPDPASPVADAALAVGGADAADLRAGQPERQRYRAALRCRLGHAHVAVGERGAALTGLPDLGLVLVDDEANPAYKERRSPHHHARDVALARARMVGATAVLLGELPSAALWRLLEAGHVTPARAHRPTERERAPRVDVADLDDPRPGARARLTSRAARALSEAVAEGRAAIVLAARGGQGAALACTGCGTRLVCADCGGSLRPDREDEAVRQCPACGWRGPARACEACGDTRTAPLAAGAGRLATELARAHPTAEIARMEGFDADGPKARPAIGVMTRGSVVTRPRWLAGERAAVLVVPDADALRARPALEAGEDALRLWMDAAREADRVVVQTREPGDAAVQALVRWDPDGFWRREAAWRAELGFPPARWLVAVRPAAEPAEVAAALRQALPADDEVLGPDLDGASLVKSVALPATLEALVGLREAWSREGRRVVVDVDPTSAG